MRIVARDRQLADAYAAAHLYYEKGLTQEEVARRIEVRGSCVVSDYSRAAGRINRIAGAATVAEVALLVLLVTLRR